MIQHVATTTIEGTLERFVWQKPDNAWAVGVLVDNAGRDHKVAGNIGHCRIGLSYRVDGKIESNRYGPTMKVASVVGIEPKTAAAVESYLCTLPGIGEKSAQALVRAFGPEHAIHALETMDVEAIRERADIRLTAEKLGEIRDCLCAERSSRELDLQVRKLLGDLSTDKLVKKILEEWGERAPSLIHQNPWMLTDLPQIGFIRADAVAQRIGAALESPERIQAAINYVIEDLRGSGHTKHAASQIIERTVPILGLPGGGSALILEGIEAMIESRLLIEAESDSVQLAADFIAEEEIAKLLQNRLAAAQSFGMNNPLCGATEPKGLFPDQVEALRTMRFQGPGGTCLLTGAPGTGKTTMVRAFFHSFAPEKIALCAPTGKAAKRLAQQAGMPASTIHRLLDPKPYEDQKGNVKFGFTKGIEDKVAKDLVVVDEASMVDVRLFRDLLRAIPNYCYLLIVGDPNQLPSVSPGSVLRDLIECGKVAHAKLTQIKRTNPGPLLTAIHAVKDGRWSTFQNDPASDLFSVPAQTETECIHEIATLYLDRLPALLEKITKASQASESLTSTTVNPVQDIQVLVPWRSKKGLSAKTINEEIQRRRAESGTVTMHGKFAFGVGDKVIQTSNDYKLGIVNGDQGVVIDIVEDFEDDGDGKKKWKYAVEFTGYERPTLVPCIGNDLDLAYAVTIHKSQGSEWPIIVLPTVGSHSSFYDRTLFYTALSRASKAMVLVGPQRGLQQVVDRITAERRRTHLQQQIAALAATATATPNT